MNSIVLTKSSGQAEIRDYFNGVLEAAKSSEQYPVNLDDVWMLVYSNKTNAVSALKKTFMQNVDYQVLMQNQENLQGGRPEKIYHLTTSCLEYFIARKVRPVFEVYRQVFHNAANGEQQLPMNYKDALRALIAKEEERERLLTENKEQRLRLQAREETIVEQERRIIKDAPKVEYYDKVLAAKGDLNVSEIARYLGMTAAELNQKLKAAGVIYKPSKSSKTWLLRKPFCNWNLANSRTSIFTRSDGSEGASVTTVYNQRGVRFIRVLHECEYNTKEAIKRLAASNKEENNVAV